MIRCINNYNHNAEDSACFCGRKPCLKSLLQIFVGGSKHADVLDVSNLNFQRDFDMVIQQRPFLLLEKLSDHGLHTKEGPLKK